MKTLSILASIALCFVTTSFAQTTRVGANCDLASFGEKGIAPFVTFDHELREALAKPDPSKLALLVEYPLRVNDSHGSYYIRDAASLDGHLPEIFTQRIRQVVANQKFTSINCFGSGIMYGNGDLWVDDTSNGFEVRAVNVGPVEDSPRVGRTEFACRTDKQRVVIDIGQNGLPRYRSWDRSHPLMQQADVLVEDGKKELEGTGYCTHPVWSFAKGQTKIEVSGLGCFPDSNQPPRTATGQLSITSGKEEHWWWCF